MNSPQPHHRPAAIARPPLACALALSLVALVGRAGDAPAPLAKPANAPTSACATAQTCAPAATTPATAVARPVAPIEAVTETARLHVASAGARDLPDFEFRDNGDLVRRLADMRSLPVMTLWQTRRTQIYLGVDQKGLAGLHFRQRGAGELSTLWRSKADAPAHVAVMAAPQAPRSLAP